MQGRDAEVAAGRRALIITRESTMQASVPCAALITGASSGIGATPGFMANLLH
jgi:hypothetical protein